jgi:hypothetical protein
MQWILQLLQGTLSHFADEDLNSLPVSKSVHLLGFADLL